MSYEGSISGPRVVAYNLASQTYEYMMRAINLGVFEGSIGQMKFTPPVQGIIDALHTVLAGGAVEITVTQRGNPDILNELNNRIRASMDEANEINKKAGYYFTALG